MKEKWAKDGVFFIRFGKSVPSPTNLKEWLLWIVWQHTRLRVLDCHVDCASSLVAREGVGVDWE